MNNEKISETLRTMRDAMNQAAHSLNTVAANTTVLYTLLVEQMGNHTVVSAEFVLPEHWYTPNCPEATEWAKAMGHDPEDDIYIVNDNSDQKIPADSYSAAPPRKYSLLYTDQFIQHVWKPWKAGMEKPRYWKCMFDGGYGKEEGSPKKDMIYPAEYNNWGNPDVPTDVAEFAQEYPHEWQPATEAEYLAQEAAKQQNHESYIDLRNQLEVEHLERFEKEFDRPDTDISNLTEPKFKVGDEVELFDGGDWQKGIITEKLKSNNFQIQFNGWSRSAYANQLRPYTPPKFDTEKADKTKMYFAVHKEFGEGTVRHDDRWHFDSSSDYTYDLSNCTHIDHEPITRRN